jgi:hypothetical protein
LNRYSAGLLGRCMNMLLVFYFVWWIARYICQGGMPFSIFVPICWVYPGHFEGWDSHINSITTKANKTLGFLRRNINISLTTVKEQAYKSLVRPSLEYACSVWDPYVTPRYLALSACSSWCPCRVYEYFIGVLFRVMDSTLHLLGWKAIFHLCSHMLSFSNFLSNRTLFYWKERHQTTSL